MREFKNGSIKDVQIKPLKKHSDERGWLIEIYRQDEKEKEEWPAMTYTSLTEPGKTRGPHEHKEQTDYFAFTGPGEFKLYLWDNRTTSSTYNNKMTITVGETNPTAVSIPPGVVHAYKCTSKESGRVLNAPNKLYAGWGKKEIIDEIRYEEEETEEYKLD